MFCKTCIFIYNHEYKNFNSLIYSILQYLTGFVNYFNQNQGESFFADFGSKQN